VYLCGASGGCFEGHVQHLALSCWVLCGALLPGVPHLLQQKWPAVSAELQAAVQLAPFSNRVVRLLSEDEAAVAPLLDTLAAEWGSEISLGAPGGGTASALPADMVGRLCGSGSPALLYGN